MACARLGYRFGDTADTVRIALSTVDVGVGACGVWLRVCVCVCVGMWLCRTE